MGHLFAKLIGYKAVQKQDGQNLSEMSETLHCNACKDAGLKSKMLPYQINMDEAILMCSNSECVFALCRGTDHLQSNMIIIRKAEDMFKSKSSERKIAIQKPQVQSEDCKNSVINWENTDALCWLHSALCLVVHNNTIKQLISQVPVADNSLLRQLYDQYAKAQYISSVDLPNAKKVLEDIRNLIWNFLCPKMKCILGVNDSPLFALALLLRENVVTDDRCIHECTWEMTCQSCQHVETTRLRKHVVTIPNTPENFSLQEPTFLKPCPMCKANNQISKLTLKSAPDVIFFHFVEGVNSADFVNYRYNHDGCIYHVTQFIQYKHNPDHFICWTRHINVTSWLCLDDLKSPLQSWSDKPPNVSPSEVHIIALQRVSSTCSSTILDKNMNSINILPKEKLNLKDDKKSIENELERKLTITDDSKKPSSKECFKERCPLRDVTEHQGTPHVCRTIINRENGTTSTYHVPSSAMGSSSKIIQYKMKLKRLSNIYQFQPFVAKNSTKLSNEFQPYVPKSKRQLLEGKKCELMSNPQSPTNIVNSPVDSGYSSPSSVGSCTSNTAYSKDDSIADQLEKLLPDCLESSVPIKDICMSQEDFIEQLLLS